MIPYLGNKSSLSDFIKQYVPKNPTKGVEPFGGGFGIESGAVVYQSGDTHRFYTGTTSSAYGTERFKVYGSGVNVVGDYYDDGRLIQDHLFNNLGRIYGTFTDFNTPTDFGCHFIQGSTNSPNTN